MSEQPDHENVGKTAVEPEDEVAKFFKYYYPEIRYLAKHFLTLISGSIVLSVTFSTDIVEFAQAPLAARGTLMVSWLILLISLGACGNGIYLAFMAAEQASGSLLYNYGADFKQLGRKSYWWLDIAGICFGAGLLALVVAAVIRSFA